MPFKSIPYGLTALKITVSVRLFINSYLMFDNGHKIQAIDDPICPENLPVNMT